MVGETVFVLGAGFTKAFLPNAPLIVDRYFPDEMVEKFAKLPYAKRILDEELSRNNDGAINLERLMTRLDSMMPYDIEGGHELELKLLLSHLKLALIERLKRARMYYPYVREQLKDFADFCLRTGSHIVSFNYDDVLDQALVEKSEDRKGDVTWDPANGYGFLCKDPLAMLGGSVYGLAPSPLYLLKLHGSVNWRVKLGSAKPYSLEAFVYLEPGRGGEVQDALLDLHLEKDAFIVPPLLQKAALVSEPVLRFVWSMAFQFLAGAQRLIFIGYSLPITDLGARFLFMEAVRPSCSVTVVDLREDATSQAALQENYQGTLPWVSDFQFEDARLWLNRFVSRERT
jgi:hypothetical protein